ncbi:malonic semialdehyde reductase [Sphingomonas sp.]|jgi:3-hydroxypropanoate dehydrogenase|uniref:malonic semialdehyde reductase n=1 Tax=Sphingomonas sp. TaxID=28214 RepID=UPI002EDEFEE8
MAWDNVRAARAKGAVLDAHAIDIILGSARSHYAWTARPIDPALLQAIYDATAAGPTSMNSCPARFVFVQSSEGKAKLGAAVKPANFAKMADAPVTAIIAYDREFWRLLPELFPHDERRAIFADNPALAEETAFRNSTLQGAYFMIAARAYGLDVGAMSGFSNAVVDDAFFAGTSVRSNFLCNLGYADETALFAKLPRLPFAAACSVR